MHFNQQCTTDPDSEGRNNNSPPLLPNGLDTINDRASEFTDMKNMNEQTLKKTATLGSLTESAETGGFAKGANSSPPLSSQKSGKDLKFSSLGSENNI